MAVLAFLLFVLRAGGDPAATGADPATRGPAGPSTGPGLSPTREAAALRVELLLLPDEGVEALPGSVEIGLGVVSAEAASRHVAWLQGGEGAGAERVEDLAEVLRWIPAPARRRDDGSVVVGPVDLPAADRYDLRARGQDGLRFYRARFTADDVPEQVAPLVAAGLRLRLHGTAPSARLQLQRRGVPSGPALWQDLMRSEAPRLLSAFDDAGIAVETNAVLSPLPPAPVEAVLWVAGVEAGRKPLELTAGRITSLVFDAKATSTAAALSTRVLLEPVDAASGAPITGTEALWARPQGEARIVADAAGRLPLDGLDPLLAHAVEIRLPAVRDADGLPRWLERMHITLNPEDEDMAAAAGRGGELRRRLAVAPLRWLVVEAPTGDASPPARPYPVHVLQRRGAKGWSDVASEHFLPVGDGLAVSITEAGEYRAMRADRPWQVRSSTTARFAATGTPKQRVRLGPASPRTTTLQLLAADGRPLARHPVALVGPHQGLPALSLTTDAEGRLRLDGASVDALFLEPTGMAGVSVPLDAGLVQVRVPEGP